MPAKRFDNQFVVYIQQHLRSLKAKENENYYTLTLQD